MTDDVVVVVVDNLDILSLGFVGYCSRIEGLPEGMDLMHAIGDSEGKVYWVELKGGWL